MLMSQQLIDPKVVEELQDEDREIRLDGIQRLVTEAKRFDTKSGNLLLKAFQAWKKERGFSDANATFRNEEFLKMVRDFTENMSVLDNINTRHQATNELKARLECASMIDNAITHLYKSLVFNSDSATRPERRKALKGISGEDTKALVALGMGTQD